MISYLPIISYCDSSGRVGDSGLRWGVRDYQRCPTKGAMVGVGKEASGITKEWLDSKHGGTYGT